MSGRTAYVDAVAVSPERQGRGIGRAVMEHLATAIADYEIPGLETDRQSFYERLGWESQGADRPGLPGCEGPRTLAFHDLRSVVNVRDCPDGSFGRDRTAILEW